jgi:hypothetical protein
MLGIAKFGCIILFGILFIVAAALWLVRRLLGVCLIGAAIVYEQAYILSIH